MHKSQEIINEVASMMLELDSSWQSSQIIMTDEDVMNATLIFQSVIGNRFCHKCIEQWKSITDSMNKAEEMGNKLSDYIKEHIWLDTKTFYKKVE